MEKGFLKVSVGILDNAKLKKLGEQEGASVIWCGRIMMNEPEMYVE